MSYKTSGYSTPAELLLHTRSRARQQNRQRAGTIPFVRIAASPVHMLTQQRSTGVYQPRQAQAPLFQRYVSANDYRPTNRFYNGFNVTSYLVTHMPLAGRAAQPAAANIPTRAASSPYYRVLMETTAPAPIPPATPVLSPAAGLQNRVKQASSQPLPSAIDTKADIAQPRSKSDHSAAKDTVPNAPDLQIVPSSTERRIIAGAGAPPPPPPSGFTKNLPLDALDLADEDDCKDEKIDYTSQTPLAAYRDLVNSIENALSQLRMRIDFDLDITSLDPVIYANRRDLEISRRVRHLQQARSAVTQLISQAIRRLTRLAQQAELDGEQAIADELHLLLNRLNTMEASVQALLPEETLEVDTRFPENISLLVARLQRSGTEMDELIGNLIEVQRNHRLAPHSSVDNRTNRVIESQSEQSASLIDELIQALHDITTRTAELEREIPASQIEQSLIDVLQYFITQLDNRMHFTRAIIFEVQERESQISVTQSLERRLIELNAMMVAIQARLDALSDTTSPEYQAMLVALRSMQARANQIQNWQQQERQSPTPLRSAQNVLYRPVLEQNAQNFIYEECIEQQRNPDTGEVRSSLTRRVREADTNRLLQEQSYVNTLDEATGKQSTIRHIKGIENGKLVRFELESVPDEDKEDDVSQRVLSHNHTANKLADNVDSLVQDYNALLNQSRVRPAQARALQSQAQALSDEIDLALAGLSTDIAQVSQEESEQLTAILQSVEAASQGVYLVLQHLTSLIVHLDSAEQEVFDLSSIDSTAIASISQAFANRIDSIDTRLTTLYSNPNISLDDRNRELSIIRRDARNLETEIVHARQAAQRRIDQLSLGSSQASSASPELIRLNELLRELDSLLDTLSRVIPSSTGSISSGSGRRLSFSRRSLDSFSTDSHEPPHTARRMSQRPRFSVERQTSMTVAEEVTKTDTTDSDKAK